MDCDLSSLCWSEYVCHSEKSSMVLPSRTCRAIHQDTGGTWLYQGQSVRSEWQFPQARTKTCADSESNERGAPTFLGLLADSRSVSTCPTTTAMAAKAKIGFSVLIIESYRSTATA